MKRRRVIAAAFFVVWLCVYNGACVTVSAAEDFDGNGQAEKAVVDQEALKSDLMEEFSFEDIDRTLKEIFPEEKIAFGETVQALMKGDMEASGKLFKRMLADQISYEFRYNKRAIVQMLLIAVIAAVFTNFSNVFRNQQISETGFYILYLLLITLGLNAFRVVVDSVAERIDMLGAFMKVLSPVYFLAVGLSTKSMTAVVFYNLVLILIYLIELILLNILIPLLHVYIMIKVLNHLSREDYLSKLAELIEMVCEWSLKTFVGCVVGLNLIQGLITPVIDGLKKTAFTKGLEAIPGIGDALGGVTEVVLGTTVLVKNGIGTAGAVICIAICAVPLLQIAMMAFLYKMVAAVVQPISDKRIVSCLGSIGDGCRILMRIVFTAGFLFLITIAVVSATTT